MNSTSPNQHQAFSRPTRSRLLSLALALAGLAVPGVAHAACIGISGGATASLVGSTLEIYGTSNADMLWVIEDGSSLKVYATAPVGDSCEGFSIASVSEIHVWLGDGGDNYYGDTLDIDQTVSGEGDADWIYTGSGDDTIYGDDGMDIVESGAGNDILDGGAGNDILDGGDGNDDIDGGNGDDTIYGGLGHDLIGGGHGGDTIYGEEDNDWIGGDCDIKNELNETIYDQFDCSDSGSSGVDTIYGGSGSDLISGGGSSDDIYGGDGNDYLIGNGGNSDRLWGEGGNDLISDQGDYSSSTWFRGYGGDGNDMLIVHSERCMLEGNAGPDLLSCSGNKDVDLQGGSGDDSLYHEDAFPDGSGNSGDDNCYQGTVVIEGFGISSCSHDAVNDFDDAVERFMNKAGTISEHPFAHQSWWYLFDDALREKILSRVTVGSFDTWNQDRSVLVHDVESY